MHHRHLGSLSCATGHAHVGDHGPPTLHSPRTLKLTSSIFQETTEYGTALYVFAYGGIGFTVLASVCIFVGRILVSINQDEEEFDRLGPVNDREQAVSKILDSVSSKPTP